MADAWEEEKSHGHAQAVVVAAPTAMAVATATAVATAAAAAVAAVAVAVVTATAAAVAAGAAAAAVAATAAAAVLGSDRQRLQPWLFGEPPLNRVRGPLYIPTPWDVCVAATSRPTTTTSLGRTLNAQSTTIKAMRSTN